MGREIRKVPADWEHPTTEDNSRSSDRVGDYRPLMDSDYVSACHEWLAGLDLWRAGKHQYQIERPNGVCRFFWEYQGGPPDEELHRERVWTEAEATHYQICLDVRRCPLIGPTCCVCEDPCGLAFGLAVWEGRLAEDHAAEWGGNAACERCHDLHARGVLRPGMTFEEARRLALGVPSFAFRRAVTRG